MKQIAQSLLAHPSRTVPILSFPAAQILGITVQDFVTCAEEQCRGMLAIRSRAPIGACLNMMDLSVEAEAFGAGIRFSADEIPTVAKGVIEDIYDAEGLQVPSIGAGRTEIYIEGIRQAKAAIADLPVFCGVIGPYSLAGRLYDMTELMYACYDDPEAVKVLLSKCAAFITDYILAFKKAGADGVILAEPAAGLLSPALAEEFSTCFVKEIFDAVNDPEFVLAYHNCGNAVADMTEALQTLPADIFHFGNAIKLETMLKALPSDRIVMGNVDPVLFKTGTPDDIREATQKVYDACSGYPNFMLSSGCDIPYDAKWNNLDAYFQKVQELYA